MAAPFPAAAAYGSVMPPSSVNCSAIRNQHRRDACYRALDELRSNPPWLPTNQTLDMCKLPVGARWCKAQIRVQAVSSSVGAATQHIEFAMACWSGGDTVCNTICHSGSWETDNVQGWLSPDAAEVGSEHKHRARPMAMLDIGANVGWYSMLFALSGWKVVAVEAHPLNAALLNTSICANPAVRDRVTLLNFGLQSRRPRGEVDGGCHAVSTDRNKGNMRLCCGSDFPSRCAGFGSGHGLRERSDEVPKFIREVRYTDHGQVRLTTLDDALNGLQPLAFDVVQVPPRSNPPPLHFESAMPNADVARSTSVSRSKMDVEGYECEVVRGGRTIFGSNTRPPHTIRVELNSDPPFGLGMKDCNATEFTKSLLPSYHVEWQKWAPAGDYADTIFSINRRQRPIAPEH